MMIDRKTALVCAALIALMLAAAVTRIMILDDWPRQASLSEALRIWQFFALPFIAAMLVMSRNANGRQATAVEARIEPCCHWGEFLSIDVCLCVLLMQGLQIATSLGPHVPLFAVVAAGATIVAAEAMNPISEACMTPDRRPRLVVPRKNWINPFYGLDHFLIAFTLLCMSGALLACHFDVLGLFPRHPQFWHEAR
jgi:hypothetical protein